MNDENNPETKYHVVRRERGGSTSTRLYTYDTYGAAREKAAEVKSGGFGQSVWGVEYKNRFGLQFAEV